MAVTLDVTIGSVPSPTPDEGIGHDLQLVKAALLYGDHATLISPATRLFAPATMLVTSASPEEVLRSAVASLKSIPRPLPSPLDLMQPVLETALADLQHLSKRRRLSRQEKSRRRAAIELANGIRANALAAEDDPLLAGLAELGRAQRQGHLHVEPLDDLWDEAAPGAIPEWGKKVLLAASSGRTHMLLDDRGRQFLAAAAQRSTPPAQEPGVKAVALAERLFRSLPLFECASISDIVDIREELSAPLARFRTELIELSASVQSQPWDEAFEASVVQLVADKVAPAVAEVAEAAQSNSYLRELALEAGRTAPQTAAALLGVGVTTALGITAPVAAMLVGGAATAANAAKAYDAWREHEDEVRGNAMYFYYAAAKRLGPDG